MKSALSLGAYYRIGMLKDIDHIIIDNAVAELMYLKKSGHGS